MHGEVCKPKDFLGELCVVLFTPEHLQLVWGSPRLRRQYLDRTLVQLSTPYVLALGQYYKILKHRNALLKEIQHGKGQDWELDIWDTRLIKEAELIWEKRQAFIVFLQKEIGPLYKGISGTTDELKLNAHFHNEDFEDRLAAHRSLDLRFDSTSVGPHRDDFGLTLNGKNLAQEESAAALYWLSK